MSEQARILDGDLYLGGDGDTAKIFVGAKTTQKVGFYGAEPIAQRAGAAQAALAAYVGGTAGLDNATNMQALYDQVVEIRNALVAVGLIKGSA